MDSLFEPPTSDPPTWESELARERRAELEEALRRRDDGARAAELNTLPVYRRAFLDWWRALPAGSEAVVDDATDAVGQPLASSRNALGGLMRAVVAEGLVERAGFVQSRKASRNGGWVMVWRRTGATG